MSAKQDLLSQAAREYKAFHETIHGLNEEHLNEAWLGTWSVKDIVAHIIGWQRELAPALERIARGERPIAEGVSYDDVDAWNAEMSLLTGMCAAKLMIEAGIGVLRTLPEPDDGAVEWLRRSAKSLGISWPRNSGAAQAKAKTPSPSPTQTR